MQTAQLANQLLPPRAGPVCRTRAYRPAIEASLPVTGQSNQDSIDDRKEQRLKDDRSL